MNHSHTSLVEKVSSALEAGDMEEDSSNDEDLSDEDDDVLSDDDCSDDDMTLNQYQEEARRDALIRKSSLVAEVSSKKGELMLRAPAPKFTVLFLPEFHTFSGSLVYFFFLLFPS